MASRPMPGEPRMRNMALSGLDKDGQDFAGEDRDPKADTAAEDFTYSIRLCKMPMC